MHSVTSSAAEILHNVPSSVAEILHDLTSSAAEILHDLTSSVATQADTEKINVHSWFTTVHNNSI